MCSTQSRRRNEKPRRLKPATVSPVCGLVHFILNLNWAGFFQHWRKNINIKNITIYIYIINILCQWNLQKLKGLKGYLRFIQKTLKSLTACKMMMWNNSSSWTWIRLHVNKHQCQCDRSHFLPKWGTDFNFSFSPYENVPVIQMCVFHKKWSTLLKLALFKAHRQTLKPSQLTVK